MKKSSFINSLWRFAFRAWPFAKGRGRLFRAAWKRIGGLEICRDDFGNTLLLDLDNFIDSHIFLTGSFEKDGIVLLQKLISQHRCDHFIDIGANLGAYSITLARHPLIEKVTAFEPDPRNFGQLSANLFLNRLHSKVTAYPIALGDEEGSEKFFISESKKEMDAFKLNRGTSSLAFREGRHTESIIVQTRRLDDMISAEKGSVAIKIDVEGFEVGVLRGMRKFLSSNNCVLHVEIFPEHLVEVMSFMSDVSYEVVEPRLEGDNFIFRKRGMTL